MRSFCSDDDGASGAGVGGGGGDAARDLFVTETMAELSARQGRLADAVAIYRRLLAGGASEDKRTLWQGRLAALEGRSVAVVTNATEAVASPGARRASEQAPAPGLAPAAAAPPLRMPLLVQTPVRSGQIVYAEGRDLIVLASVNPGAQLLADGHIHIYGPLRGRAVAGVRGAADAQIFCHRLEAELVGIDSAYVPAEDLPADLVGKAVRVWMAEGACRFARL